MNTAAKVTQAGRGHLAVIGAGLVFVTALLYWPVLRHEFINYYDDGAYIVDNPHVNAGLSWAGVRWALGRGYAANWHPLTWISHMLDCQLFGLNPAGAHLINLLLHVANTLLLFVWLSRLTGAIWRSALVAALFAWHPTHVESVAWAAERKDVLSAFFFLLTLIAYTRYAREQSKMPAEKSTFNAQAYYWSAVVFFAFGLMSKPMVVTLPFVLLVLDFWPLGRFAQCGLRIADLKSGSAAAPSSQYSNTPLLRLMVEKLPFLALSAAVCFITYSVQKSGGAMWRPGVLPVSLRLENATLEYVRYLSKIFRPTDLALIYPYPHDWPPGLVASALLMLLMWTAVFLVCARQSPYWLAGWLWFLGMLVPTIGLVQVGVQSMADRYLYLPAIGVFVAVAWGLGDLVSRWPRSRSWVAGAVAAALAGCLMVSRVQLSYWQNSLALFTHTVRVTTRNYAADDLLGNLLERSGRKEEAFQWYDAAVQVEPDFPLSQFHMGMLLLESGRKDEASNHLATAAKLMPDDPDVQYDLGVFLRGQENPSGAADCFAAALARRPDFPGALNDLAWIRATAADANLRSGPEAVRLAQRACQLAGDDPAYLTTLGAAWAESGRFPEAVATVERARDRARAAGKDVVLGQDEALLKQFQAGQPWRE